MALASGTRLGPYEIHSLVGAGGMGEVYRARDTTLERDVALKLLPEALAADPDRLSRFHREAKALASLSHPNIAQVFGLEQSSGRPCIVMELLQGQTLRQRIALGPLRVQEAVDVAIAVADALGAVHAQGITHRDLKPDNIFLTADGRVKILDFGLARATTPDIAAAATMAGTNTEPGLIMGTVGYMSPEQVRGQQADAPSDLFAIGCVLYEMLTGRRAFERPSTAETLAAIMNEEPRALDIVRPDLGRIVRRCLKKQAHERFHSAQDLAVDLRGLATPGDVDAPADSLAVLPFTNAGGADAEYLSDGIAESLINSFSQIAGLRVVPRSVAFRYKGRDMDPREVARELDVRMLLSGKVVERGGRLSVQVELVDAVANKQLWGERIVRPLTDIFEVEEEIARQIADQLRLRLSGEDRKQLARRYTDDSEAYQLYLRARFNFLKRTVEGLQAGIRYCEQAIARDSGFALAYAAMADCYLVAASFSPSSSGIELLVAKAREAATRAVAADAGLAEAQNSLAYVRIYSYEWAQANNGFRHALDLNPNSWITHDWYALALSGQGRLDEALAHNQRALELEPLSVVLMHHAAWLMWLARRHDAAIEWARQALELDPGFAPAYQWIGLALEQQSKHDAAVAALERLHELSGNVPMFVASLVHACASAGRVDEARRHFSGLRGTGDEADLDPFSMAMAHAGLGESDLALGWLEKAAGRSSIWLTLMAKSDPRLDRFRDDPRFTSVLRAMKLDS